MKNSIFITIFLSLLSLSGMAQEIDATPEMLLRSNASYEVIGTIDGVTMVIFKESDRFKVKAFDETLNRKWERELRLEKRSAKFVGIIPRKKSFFVFYRYKHKGRQHLRMREYNSSLKMIDSTLIKLYPRRSFSPKPDMYYSKNKNQILFLSEKDDKFLDAIVYNRKLKKRTLDIKIAPDDFSYKRDFLEALVDNKGGVHLILEKDNRKSKRATNRLDFITILHSSNNIKYYSLSFNKNLWYDLETKFDNRNDQILISGLYSDKSAVEAHGIFYMNVKPSDTDNPVVKFTPFDNEHLTLVLGKEIKKNVGFGDVSVQKIIPRSDGGILMIAERNREYVRNTTSYSSYYGRNHNPVQTDYYFNEILLYSFNPDGSVHWKEILHKKQFSQDDNGAFSSFFLFFNRNNLRLIYNDVIKSTSTVYEYVVSGDGEADRSSLFNTKPHKFMLKMSEAMQISSNTLIVPSERRSQLRLVRLTF